MQIRTALNVILHRFVEADFAQLFDLFILVNPDVSTLLTFHPPNTLTNKLHIIGVLRPYLKVPT